MKVRDAIRLVLVAILCLAVPCAWGMDMRFDVATDNNNGNDTDWFGPAQLTNLNFPSVNGHNIEQGGSSSAAAIAAEGNSLGVYYDTFDDLYSSTETPAAAASTVQSWIKSMFGSTETSSWIVLNEVNSSVWDSSSGDAYRTWLVNTMQAMNSLGYTHIILFAENSLGTSTYASTWQGITKYAYVGDECFIDGPTVEADNFSVSTLQQTYQAAYNSWTTGAGISASKLIECEHFSVNEYAPSTYWGADGISGAAWEEAIEARDIAIHNVPFGGFIGYAWDKDAQATGNPTIDLANQEAYEKAYASTLVTQTEVPTWTGNDGTNSWNDYLNWTGGLPSTTSAPFPLLAATNPNLPLQTSANFLSTIQTNTTVTLDGNESTTNLTFGSAYSYTIAPGTGGVLTVTGPNASISVTIGSHYITAGTVVASDVAANIAGNLTMSGGLTNNGYTLTKSGAGILTLSGTQNNAANSVVSMTAGTLNIDNDEGTAAAPNLALSISSGDTNINAAQHLASLSLTGGIASVKTNGQYLLTHSFSISGSAAMDLTDNDMIDEYSGSSPLSAISAAIATGANTVGTRQAEGLFSSSSLSHPYTTLGYAPASVVLGLTGNETGIWDGQVVNANTILVKYTWDGDVNLDGVVNAEDLALMQMGGTTWSQGDFNHDGTVDAEDYALYADGLAASGGQNISTIEPEPSLAWLFLLFPLFSCHRSRCSAVPSCCME